MGFILIFLLKSGRASTCAPTRYCLRFMYTRLPADAIDLANPVAIQRRCIGTCVASGCVLEHPDNAGKILSPHTSIFWGVPLSRDGHGRLRCPTSATGRLRSRDVFNMETVAKPFERPVGFSSLILFANEGVSDFTGRRASIPMGRSSRDTLAS